MQDHQRRPRPNEAVAPDTVKGGRCRIRDEEGLRILNDGRWRQKEHIIAWKILPFYAARWAAASTRPRASAADDGPAHGLF